MRRPPAEAGASQSGAYPSWSLGTRSKGRPSSPLVTKLQLGNALVPEAPASPASRHAPSPRRSWSFAIRRIPKLELGHEEQKTDRRLPSLPSSSLVTPSSPKLLLRKALKAEPTPLPSGAPLPP